MKTAAEDCKKNNLQSQTESFRNLSFTFHFPVLSLCTDNYSNFTLTILVILMAIGNMKHIFRRIVNTLPI